MIDQALSVRKLYKESKEINLIFQGLWIVLGFIAILLNVLSLFLLKVTKELTKIQKAYLVSFGISDLLGGVSMLVLGSFRLNDFVHECTFDQWGMLCSNYMDMYLLLFFSVQRTVVLKWPFKAYKFERNAVVGTCISLTFVLCVTLSTLSLYLTGCSLGPKTGFARNTAGVEIFFLFLPFVVIMATEIYLLSIVYKKNQQLQLQKPFAASKAVGTTEKRRAKTSTKRIRYRLHLALTTLFVFACFFLLSLPTLSVYIYVLAVPDQRVMDTTVTAEAALAINSLKAVVNPFILCFRLKAIRRRLWQYMPFGSKTELLPPDFSTKLYTTRRVGSRVKVVPKSLSYTTDSFATAERDLTDKSKVGSSSHSPHGSDVKPAPRGGLSRSVPGVCPVHKHRGSVTFKSRGLPLTSASLPTKGGALSEARRIVVAEQPSISGQDLSDVAADNEPNVVRDEGSALPIRYDVGVSSEMGGEENGWRVVTREWSKDDRVVPEKPSISSQELSDVADNEPSVVRDGEGSVLQIYDFGVPSEEGGEENGQCVVYHERPSKDGGTVKAASGEEVSDNGHLVTICTVFKDGRRTSVSSGKIAGSGDIVTVCRRDYDRMDHVSEEAASDSELSVSCSTLHSGPCLAHDFETSVVELNAGRDPTSPEDVRASSPGVPLRQSNTGLDQKRIP